MEWLNKIVDFVTDAKRKLSHRVLFALAILLGLLFLNDVFGFTYYYSSSRKVEQIAQINNLLRDPSIDTNSKKYLTKLKASTIQRQDVLQYIASYFTEVEAPVKRDTVFVTIQGGEKVYSNNRAFTHPPKNRVWHFISSNILFIIAAIAVLFIKPKPTEGLATHILGLIAMEGILVGFMFFWAWIYDFIPVIWGNPGWNYGLNAAINAVILALSAIVAYHQQDK